MSGMDDTKKYSREELRAMVDEDVAKDEPQLLTDVYDEILNNEKRTMGGNALHAAKRFSALLGKSIIENTKNTAANLSSAAEVERLTKQLKRYTVWLVLLTVFLGGLTIALYLVARNTDHTLEYIHEEIKAAREDYKRANPSSPQKAG